MHPQLSTMIAHDRIANFHRDAARMRPAQLPVDTTRRLQRRSGLSRVQTGFARLTALSPHQGI